MSHTRKELHKNVSDRTVDVNSRTWQGRADRCVQSNIPFGLASKFPTPFREEFDRISNFVLEAGPCNLQLITTSDSSRCGVGRPLIHNDRNNFAPRFGFAWQASPRTVVRSGAGVFYGRDENLGIAAAFPTIRPGSPAPPLSAIRTIRRSCCATDFPPMP